MVTIDTETMFGTWRAHVIQKVDSMAAVQTLIALLTMCKDHEEYAVFAEQSRNLQRTVGPESAAFLICVGRDAACCRLFQQEHMRLWRSMYVAKHGMTPKEKIRQYLVGCAEENKGG